MKQANSLWRGREESKGAVVAQKLKRDSTDLKMNEGNACMQSLMYKCMHCRYAISGKTYIYLYKERLRDR